MVYVRKIVDSIKSFDNSTDPRINITNKTIDILLMGKVIRVKRAHRLSNTKNSFAAHLSFKHDVGFDFLALSLNDPEQTVLFFKSSEINPSDSGTFTFNAAAYQTHDVDYLLDILTSGRSADEAVRPGAVIIHVDNDQTMLAKPTHELVKPAVEVESAPPTPMITMRDVARWNDFPEQGFRCKIDGGVVIFEAIGRPEMVYQIPVEFWSAIVFIGSTMVGELFKVKAYLSKIG
jgi:hypothetical protein